MFDSLRFVYVEDEYLNRQLAEIILRTVLQVADLEMFSDGHDIVNRLKQLSFVPDIILLDIHLNPYSGFDLLEEIRADLTFKQTKIVAITASVRVEELQRIRAKGFDGVIAKPISMQTFPDFLQHILDGQPIWDTQ